MPPKRSSQDEHDRRLKAYEETDSNVEAAERLGLNTSTFEAWARKQGLYGKGSSIVSEEEEARRFEAYHATGSDHGAAAMLGIPYPAFNAWRWRLGLPSMFNHVLPADEEARRMEAYRSYPSDALAAEALGMKRSSFTAWRLSRGLAADKGAGSKFVTPDELEAIKDAWSVYDSYTDIARVVGRSVATVRKYVQELGLPHPYEKHRERMVNGYTESEVRWWEAICDSLSDQEAANKLGVNPHAVSRWRKRNQVPPRSSKSEYWKRLKWEAHDGNPVARYYVKQRFPRTGGIP